MKIWQIIVDNIAAHWGYYTGAASVLFVASVCVMPERFPRTWQEWWTWMRDSLQTAIPAARHTVLPQESNGNETQEKS